MVEVDLVGEGTPPPQKMLELIKPWVEPLLFSISLCEEGGLRLWRISTVWSPLDEDERMLVPCHVLPVEAPPAPAMINSSTASSGAVFGDVRICALRSVRKPSASCAVGTVRRSACEKPYRTLVPGPKLLGVG